MKSTKGCVKAKLSAAFDAACATLVVEMKKW